MLMYEYRLALEFWGSLALFTVMAPLTISGVRHVMGFFHSVHDELCSAPLSSVPSSPRP
jgi:hypothetical protein